MAVQLVRVLAPVRIIAADVDATKLEQAKALGADDVVNTRNVDLSFVRL
jgi:Zn-dependent alcohol dehydrogenase